MVKKEMLMLFHKSTVRIILCGTSPYDELSYVILPLDTLHLHCDTSLESK